MIGPTKALELIHAHCRWCSNTPRVKVECTATTCPLYHYRPGGLIERDHPKAALWAKCDDCRPEDYLDCDEKACVLHRVLLECPSFQKRRSKTRSGIDSAKVIDAAEGDPAGLVLPEKGCADA